MNFEYTVVKSKRKSLAIEIKPDLSVTVRAPFFTSDAKISEFVLKHEDWINRNLVKMKERSGNKRELPREKIEMLRQQARDILPSKTAYWSRITGLYPTSIKITSAKTRFGSCSGKNAICFSYLLMLYPEDAIDYVVLHELSHIKYHNHSKQFYGFIEKYMPDYKKREELLKTVPASQE